MDDNLKEFYISLKGNDTDSCGTIDAPCYSVTKAFSLCDVMKCYLYLDTTVGPYGNFSLFVSVAIEIKIMGYPVQSGVVEFNGNGVNTIFTLLGVEGDPVSIEMYHVIFKNGYAVNGGCISISSFPRNVSFDVNNCSFWNCVAERDGGAIYVSDKVNASMNFSNCDYNNNKAGGNGGAMYSENLGDFRIENSTFENNTARDGGSLFLKGSINAFYCDFSNNSVSEDGGAIYFLGPYTEGYFESCNFMANKAKRYGGAVFSNNIQMKVSLKSNYISLNQAQNIGCGIYTQNSNVEISSSNVTKNQPNINGGKVDTLSIDIFCDNQTRKNFRSTCQFCTDKKVALSCNLCFTTNSNASCIQTMNNNTICFYNGGTCPIDINPLLSWIALASLVVLVAIVMAGVSIVLCRFKYTDDGREYMQI